jgi:hypothetical protein
MIGRSIKRHFPEQSQAECDALVQEELKDFEA